MEQVIQWGCTSAPESGEEYFSAELQLENPRVLFLFKLRKTESEEMFVLAKTGSRVLECVKQGDVLPVIYHFQDRAIPGEQKMTRIKSVEDGGAIGFKDHVVIALDLAAIQV